MPETPDPTITDVPLEPGDDVDEGEPAAPTEAIPDEPDEAEGEAWEAEKDVTPDASADDAVTEEPAAEAPPDEEPAPA